MKKNIILVLIIITQIIAHNLIFDNLYAEENQHQASYMNFQKMAFYYSRKTNEYIIVAHSTDRSTSFLNFDKDNVHAVIMSKDGNKTAPIKREDLIVVSLGNMMHKGAEKYTLFRFNMVIDNSGSIDDGSVKIIEDLLTQFMNKIPVAFEAQIIKFSTTIQSKTAFIKDKNELIRHIKQPYKREGTALHDSVALALNELKASGDDNVYFKFCVVFTDGQDTSSQKYKDPNFFKTKIENECLNAKIPLFIVGVTSNVNQSLLKGITKKIGLYKHANSFTGPELENAFDFIINLIKDTYIFKIPAVSDFNNLKTIFLVKKTLSGYDTIQDFVIRK